VFDVFINLVSRSLKYARVLTFIKHTPDEFSERLTRSFVFKIAYVICSRNSTGGKIANRFIDYHKTVSSINVRSVRRAQKNTNVRIKSIVLPSLDFALTSLYFLLVHLKFSLNNSLHPSICDKSHLLFDCPKSSPERVHT